MFKKFLSGLLCLVIAVSFIACSTNQDASTLTEAVQNEELETEAQAEQVIGINLDIIQGQADSMKNTYTVMAVNPDAPFVDATGNSISDVKINVEGANAFVNWMLSEGAELAAQYGKEQFGDSLFFLLNDMPKFTGTIDEATDETKVVRISSTTSIKDTGLFNVLQPAFEKYGYKLEPVFNGTGKAIANAKAGNADVILVHAKAQEEKFVEDGFGRIVDGYDKERLSFMYNFFLLVGPKDDPANAKNGTSEEAFKKIADGKFLFISRGDNSGTHTKELSLWPEELGIKVEPATFEAYQDWYISANAGMGACLLQANEREAYILTDIATFLSFRANNGKIQ